MAAIQQSDTRLATLVIEIARERRSYAFTTPEIIKDGRALLKAADAARAALERGRSAAAAFARAQKLMARYHIHVVDEGDLGGTVMGLGFTDPHYLAGADWCFKLS